MAVALIFAAPAFAHPHQIEAEGSGVSRETAAVPKNQMGRGRLNASMTRMVRPVRPPARAGD